MSERTLKQALEEHDLTIYPVAHDPDGTVYFALWYPQGYNRADSLTQDGLWMYIHAFEAALVSTDSVP